MMLLTEDQVSTIGGDIIDFLSSSEETKDLTIGEWIVILSTTIFMLGQGTKVDEE